MISLTRSQSSFALAILFTTVIGSPIPSICKVAPRCFRIACISYMRQACRTSMLPENYSAFFAMLFLNSFLWSTSAGYHRRDRRWRCLSRWYGTSLACNQWLVLNDVLPMRQRRSPCVLHVGCLHVTTCLFEVWLYPRLCLSDAPVKSQL
jgi:hypothetical protein